MKRLLIGILICTMYLCVIWGIYDQVQKGNKYKAARVAAMEGRGK